MSKPDGLKPFFSYFGSKFRLARHYPPPKRHVIIEPFAGSAGYSLLHHSGRQVRLYDTYEPVVQLWQYLINVAESEIRGLPLEGFNKVKKGEGKLESMPIAEEAKLLIGFWLTQSQTYASTYGLSKQRTNGWSAEKRETIASQLQYIRNWSASSLSYESLHTGEDATWFVDPPYAQGGERYKENKIDHASLGRWCRNLKGQVIACEQESKKSNWLEFIPLKNYKNASNEKYMEVYWHKAV